MMRTLPEFFTSDYGRSWSGVYTRKLAGPSRFLGRMELRPGAMRIVVFGLWFVAVEFVK